MNDFISFLEDNNLKLAGDRQFVDVDDLIISLISVRKHNHLVDKIFRTGESSEDGRYATIELLVDIEEAKMMIRMAEL